MVRNADLKTEIGNINLFNVTANKDSTVSDKRELQISVEMTDKEVIDEMKTMGKKSIKKAIKATHIKKRAKEA